jgi:hypothetical protein
MKEVFLLANSQLPKLLPAMKVELIVVVEPGTMLQGDAEHPVMLMDKALYKEPVTQPWK